MIINRTTSYCRQCDATHDAQYVREGDTVVYEVACPRGTRRQPISTGAELFMDIRENGSVMQPSAVTSRVKKHFYFLEITNVCNIECPICYADAHTSNSDIMSLETVRELGRRIKTDGGRWVSVTGGEPTMHLDLPEILSILRHELGLSPLIVTNGIRIADDYQYLLALKKAGLRKVQLQFDTLNRDTYELMRGRVNLDEKYRAIDNITRAGLRLGLVATVCRYNLAEVNDIIDFAVNHTPVLNTLILQGMLPVGRFPSEEITVDRESIIRQVARGGNHYSIEETDFQPFPRYAPMSIEAHPDCEISVFMKVDKRRAESINRGLDVPRLRQLTSKYENKMEPWRANWTLLRCFSRAAKNKRVFIDLLSRMRSIRSGKGNRNLFLITIGSFMHPAARDEERLRRCVSCKVSEQGFESMCGREISGIPSGQQNNRERQT
jgi:uncharacterized radical SAM superfamily Fe-S cluster-containing enzyme